jgi:uncharacterized protein (DUF2267 family)
MAATGLDVFDKTLQATNIWLDEIAAEIGPDRQVAWHVLGAVLRALRDTASRSTSPRSCRCWCAASTMTSGIRRPANWSRARGRSARNLDEFLERFGEGLANIRPVNVRDATRAVFRVLPRHVDRGQVAKVVQALPEPIREFWPLEGTPPANDAARGQGVRPGETTA